MIDLDRRILNVRPDALDPRDRTFRDRFASVRDKIPGSANYAVACGPVSDQLYTGSCAGQAGQSFCFWIWQTTFASRWIWLGAKEMDSWMPSVAFELDGTDLRTVMKFLRKYGAAEEHLWPFEFLLPAPDLSEQIKENALGHRIGEYWRLGTVPEMKRHLAKCGPFIAGVPVFESWDLVDGTGIVPEPDGAELGGHAILVVGYDADGFMFKNSWGVEWGRQGYGYLGYGSPIWDAWGTGMPAR
jgi:hypothetical protein